MVLRRFLSSQAGLVDTRTERHFLHPQSFLPFFVLVFVPKLVNAKHQNRRQHRHTRTNLGELLLFQIPLLDAVVPGAAEQHISLHRQALDAVIMWRFKVMGWTYISQSSLCHIEHLEKRTEEQMCKNILQQHVIN